MSDARDFERDIRASLDEHAPFAAPNHLLQSFEYNARRTRRYPRWLALIKEPTMRTDSRLTVGSPTARVAAIAIAMLLLATAVIGASFAGAQLLAADQTIVVDQNGDGDYTTIVDAVEAATDGDEILLKPGTYAESVTISADITLRGEDRDTVILQAGIGCTGDGDLTCPDGTPLYPDHWFGEHPYALLLDDTTAEISDVTFELGAASGIIARAGAPAIHDISYAPGADWAVLYVHDGSEAKISDADLADAWVFFEQQSPATIERSSFWAVVANTNNTLLVGGPAYVRDNVAVGIAFNGEAVVEGNQVIAQESEGDENDFYGQGIDVQAGDGFVIRDNVVSGFAEGAGIALARGGNGDIVDNTLTGNRVGIGLGNLGGKRVVSGNRLTDNETGVMLGTGAHVVTGNTVRGGSTGISVHGASTLEGNDVEGATERGIEIGGSSEAVLRDNRSCENGEDLWVADGAAPDIDASNEICVAGT
jgi:nitrous oxidase accessory protein NosD